MGYTERIVRDGKIIIATHLSKKPNPHDACTGQKESSKNFNSTPDVHKIQSQSNRIARRSIIRPQIVVATRAGGHIWWIGGPGHLCSASGIRGTCNVASGSVSSDVYNRNSLSSFIKEKGKEKYNEHWLNVGIVYLDSG